MKKTYLALFALAYDDAGEFEVGDEVNVWLSGAIGESFPAQAEAKRIKMEE